MMTNVFSPVGIDIGNRMAESLDQLGFTFLYHGTPLCMIIRNYCIFILFFSPCASANFMRVRLFLSVIP
ncbi:hypothetical protein CRG93_20315 [Escherichia sp. E2593]|nr:hypothetical protein CRG93_20315 [Escherichia sp. E2593]